LARLETLQKSGELWEGWMTRSRASQADASKYMAGIGAILLFGFIAFSPNALTAQSLAPADSPVQVGDRWTYDQREFVIRITTRGKAGSSIRVYDHDWNLIDRGDFKFKPNSGGGIKPPLAVGKEWRSEAEIRSTQSNYVATASVAAKVTAQETITTPAGTFETFKIESQRREVNSADPSKSSENQNTDWYAPQINYWVRRLLVTRVQKHITSNFSEELTSFGRKQ
jgi:hypothetical protein